MGLGGDVYVLPVLLGGIQVRLGDLMGAIWANIKKYKEIQGKVRNIRCRRWKYKVSAMDAYPPLAYW